MEPVVVGSAWAILLSEEELLGLVVFFFFFTPVPGTTTDSSFSSPRRIFRLTAFIFLNEGMQIRVPTHAIVS